MKQKKIIVSVIIAVIILVCIGIGVSLLNSDHEHSFGEWETQTPATCESPEIEVRRCSCGEEETREGDPAIGHTFVSIAAESKLEKPMATMVVQVSDLTVTAVCGTCGESFVIPEGIELEGATLALGENTITVKYGELSTTLTIEAAELETALEGTVSEDTYVSSDNKDAEYTSKDKMGTNSSSFRIYLKVNISEILKNELFLENEENAKVQLILAITDGRVTDDTTFTLKTYAPAAGVTDVPLSKLTWNSLDNKEGSVGTYSQLHWHNGTALVSGGVGHNVSVDNDCITIMLAYSQIKDYIDDNGNILFAFATNTKGLKVGSIENKTEANKPVFRVVLNDEHFHVFDQKVAESRYFVSANCKQRTKYYTSCSCGEAGTETFTYGGVIAHNYGELIPEKQKTCTTDGVKEHYQCSRCGKYFLERSGQMKLVKEADLKISAGHDYKLIPATEPSCTKDGNNKYYKCGDCGLYFDAEKNETTKEEQKLPKLEHTFSELVPQVDATCTEDGMKAHYRCTVCEKYFIEKDGEKVAINVETLKISAGHDYKVIQANEPSCTKDGNNKYYKCGRQGCGLYFDAEKNETTKEAQKIPAGHIYSNLVPQVDATCTEDGMKAHYRCTVCEKYFVEKDGEKVAINVDSLIISAGHKYVVIQANEPTCTKEGNNKYYKCGRDGCGKYFDANKNETTKEEQKLPKLEHTYSELVLQVDATCTEEGMAAHYYCSVCNTYFDEDKAETTEEALKIPMKEHTYSNLVPKVDATCTEEGMAAHYQCFVCNTYFDENKIETTKEALKLPAGHDYKLAQSAKDPTCTESGWYKLYQCRDCGLYFDADKNETKKEAQKIPAKGHSYTALIPQVDATCTEDGMKAHYRCTACPKYFNVDQKATSEASLKISALGHTGGETCEHCGESTAD